MTYIRILDYVFREPKYSFRFQELWLAISSNFFFSSYEVNYDIKSFWTNTVTDVCVNSVPVQSSLNLYILCYFLYFLLSSNVLKGSALVKTSNSLAQVLVICLLVYCRKLTNINEKMFISDYYLPFVSVRQNYRVQQYYFFLHLLLHIVGHSMSLYIKKLKKQIQ